MDLFLSTRCPQCGAEISFEEESTVLHCRFCGSALCMTGRSGVNRTYAQPREDVARMKRALSDVLNRKKGNNRALICDKKLFFAPYWRVKGMVFRWVFGKDVQGRPIKELKTKNLDLTFPAYGGMDLGLRSLGIRPEAMKLRFFEEQEMSSRGQILNVVLPFKEAVRHSQEMTHIGLDEMEIRILLDRTRLVGERYSIIYFPFWVFRVSLAETSRVLILDAVANAVTRSLSEEQWTEMIHEVEKAPAPVSFSQVSFLPFKCPNCGWDLPLSRFNIIHVCNTCFRAWMERDGRFQAVAFDLVESPQDAESTFVYLPFWAVQAQIEGNGESLKTAGDLINFSGTFPTRAARETDRDPLQLYLPAAEIRNVSAANKLATDVTQNQPALRFMPKEYLSRSTLLGAVFPPRAAQKMADSLLCSLTPKGIPSRQQYIRDARIVSGKMKLIWWPFFEQRLFLRDAVCGCGIQKGTIPAAHLTQGG